MIALSKEKYDDAQHDARQDTETDYAAFKGKLCPHVIPLGNGAPNSAPNPTMPTMR